MGERLRNHGSSAAVLIILFFLGFFIYTKLAGPIPFVVNNYNTAKDDLFQTTGQGSASDAPDEAVISFGVTKNSTTVASAQEQTDSAIKNILKNLKNLGVNDKDIKTTNYSVNPNYDFSSGQRISGYNVSQNIELKLKDIKKTNDAIDAITGGGANLVGQIQFGFSQQAKAKLEENARKEAVENAKQKAQNIAKTAGIRLGKIINVQESSNDFPRPLPLDVGRGSAEAPLEKTEIPTGESSINISITLTYETF